VRGVRIERGYRVIRRRRGDRVLVAVSADMEGVSQLVGPREILACCPEYWETGKPRLEADVAPLVRGC